MYLQEIVEVAIGLIFAWLLLSIAVLQIQEIIATTLSKRAKDLESAIGNMLKSEDYLKEFYDHPLIQGLIEPMAREKKVQLKAIRDKEKNIEKKKIKTEDSENKKTSLIEAYNRWAAQHLTPIEIYRKWTYTREEAKSNARKPSYIPSANFSAALFDVIVKAGDKDSPIQFRLSDLRKSIDGITNEDSKKTAKVALAHILQLGQMAANSEAGSEFQKGLKVELKNQVTLLGEKFSNISGLSQDINKAIDDYQFDLKSLFTSDQFLEQVDTGIKTLLLMSTNMP